MKSGDTHRNQTFSRQINLLIIGRRNGDTCHILHKICIIMLTLIGYYQKRQKRRHLSSFTFSHMLKQSAAVDVQQRTPHASRSDSITVKIVNIHW